MSPHSPLDALLDRARTVQVRPEHAVQRVAEVDRWMRRSAPRRWPAFALGFGLAAVLALVLVWWWPQHELGAISVVPPV